MWASMADEPDSDDRYLVHDGDACDPKAWEGLLIEIGRVERFEVLIHHADKLRRLWSELLVGASAGTTRGGGDAPVLTLTLD